MNSNSLGVAQRPHSFQEKENLCRFILENELKVGQSFWHVCTPGTYQYVVFETGEDYVAGMLFAATSAHDAGVRIITFELMSNHVHFVLCCSSKEIAKAFLILFRERLTRHFNRVGKYRNLSGFDSEPIAIETLESLRNQIAYTNRNNYVIDPSQTPFSFPYGANSCYFNPFAKSVPGRYYGDLSDRAKIRLLHSKRIDYPGNYVLTSEGFFSPASFCDISFGESIFRDARHYMNKLTKDIESYKEMSQLFGDLVFFTDDELISIIYSIGKKKYGNGSPALLTPQQKVDLAKTLHYDYNADNAQVSRMLHIPSATLNSLFPMVAKGESGVILTK